MWKQLAHASVQELRQMVFDMDSELKITIDKHSSQEQDFKKLGFQVIHKLQQTCSFAVKLLPLSC